MAQLIFKSAPNAITKALLIINFVLFAACSGMTQDDVLNASFIGPVTLTYSYLDNGSTQTKQVEITDQFYFAFTNENSIGSDPDYRRRTVVYLDEMTEGQVALKVGFHPEDLPPGEPDNNLYRNHADFIVEGENHEIDPQGDITLTGNLKGIYVNTSGQPGKFYPKAELQNIMVNNNIYTLFSDEINSPLRFNIYKEGIGAASVAIDDKKEADPDTGGGSTLPGGPGSTTESGAEVPSEAAASKCSLNKALLTGSNIKFFALLLIYIGSLGLVRLRKQDKYR